MESQVLVSAARRVALTRKEVAAFVEEARGEDFLAALEAALEASDERAVTVLAIAASAMGLVPEAALLRRVLPCVEDTRVALSLVGACPDDPFPMLIDLAASEELSDERQSAMLWAAVERLDGHPAPRELVALLRLHARRRLGPDAAALMALAARTVGDPDLLKVADAWIELTVGPLTARLEKSHKAALRAVPLESLDEEPLWSHESSTIRREVAKIGRNDPCPCGSGRKFKKCCEGKKLVAPPPTGGPARAQVPEGEFRQLSPAAIAKLPLETLSTRRLINALQVFARYRRWADAERAFEVLDQRKDLPEGATSDEYRVDLIHDAIEAGARDVVQQTVARIADPSILTPDLKLDIALLEGTGAVLGQIEAQAESALRGEEGLVDLAFTLLQHSPALGILVARGVVTPERSLDSETLLEVVEEARDRLGLPPGDAAVEILDMKEDVLLDRQIEASSRMKDAKLREEAEKLRSETRHAAAKIAALERDLRSRTVQLNRAVKARAETGARAQPTALHAGDEEEVQRLRQKVAELKGLIREGNENRTQLRKQIASLGDRLAAVEREAPAVPLPEGEEGKEDTTDDLEKEAPPVRLRVLVPEFERDARDALEKAPHAVAAKALDVVSALAGADETTWRGVKLLESAPDVRSARVGLPYRLLFQVRTEERVLRVLDLVPRGGLLTAIKRYRR